MKLTTIIAIFLLLMTFGCKENSRNSSGENSVHFSSENLGMPVGLHFFENEYHLFYKYAENDSMNGLGHLVSEDLVSWEETTPAFEFTSEEQFTSASIVRDWNNSSGLGNEDNVILAYVLKKDILSVSYSYDLGESWKNWVENINLDAPVIGVNDFKVIWNEDAQKWILVLLIDYDVEFYASDDLRNWEFQSKFDSESTVKKGTWAGVEFFPVEYKETTEIKWCLAISTTEGAKNEGLGTQYFVGNFNDLQFSTTDDVKWMDGGTDYYSPVVLSDYLLLNKTPYSIAKINKNPSLTLARSLFLIKRYNEYFITSKPVKEINQLKHKTKQLAAQEFEGKLNIKQRQQLPLEISLTFDLNNRIYLDFAEVFGVTFENENQDKLIVGYHNERRYFFIAFNNEIVFTPCVIEQREVEIQLIVNDSSLELFVMDGFISMTKSYSTETILNQLSLFTEGGKIALKGADLTELEGIR
ncbi:GH32 C-terminal domain-containing protein [Prolixibacteraceae bacterium Z1-6]|uniref:GH32 C-terminal domain-containing protein n=1 Tax=Draconibacterium aestuarii TaxID=2998507 RepID=A0A9X3FA16_9BACT|nr:GH32 C-terminal domain-containing protein [Prolixibacteraceae bacterium Z1-6]